MNMILNIPDESVLIDNTITDTNELDTNNSKEVLNNTEESEEIVKENLNDSIINEKIENNINNEIDTTTNCLALIVRENYQIVVVKNFIKKSFKVTWKVILSIVTLNFLNLFI